MLSIVLANAKRAGDIANMTMDELGRI